MSQIQQAFTVDGKFFSTKEEANQYIRRPKIIAALEAFIKDNKPLVDLLVENQDTIESAFESGSLRRFTKADQKKLQKAFDSIVAAGLKGTEFLIENWEELEIKYKPQKRMSPEEKDALAS